MRNCRLLNRDLSTVSPKITTFLLMKESGLISLPMSIARKTFGNQYLEMGHAIGTHFVLKEREFDTAVHRKSNWSEATICLPERWRSTFSDIDWTCHFWMRRSKTRFQCCMKLLRLSLVCTCCARHTGGEVIAHELMVHVGIPF